MQDKYKLQIINYPAHASCETYGCYKKTNRAIGRPDAPKQTWKFFCDDCIRDLIANIPDDLLPEIEPEDNSIEAKRDKLLDIIKELRLVDDVEFQEGLLDEIIEAFGGLEPEPKQETSDQKHAILEVDQVLIDMVKKSDGYLALDIDRSLDLINHLPECNLRNMIIEEVKELCYAAESSNLNCQYCGKECKNNAGLQAHERTCKEKGQTA